MKQGRGYKRGGVRSAPTGLGVGKAIVLVSKKKKKGREERRSGEASEM